MEKQKALNQLFEKWRDKQKSEKEESLIKTLPRGIHKDSFCEDGLINPEANEIDVLYILKESNIAKEDKDKTCQDGEFWLRDKYNEKHYKNNKIPRRLEKAQVQKFDSDINHMAFLNINKRGGTSSSQDKMLISYIDVYGEFIKEEIDAIASENIVLCFTDEGLKESMINLIGTKGFKLYQAKHPSYTGEKNGFTDDDFLKSVRKIK